VVGGGRKRVMRLTKSSTSHDHRNLDECGVFIGLETVLTVPADQRP